MGVLTTLEQDAYDADQYRGIIGASQENRLQLRKASKEARAAVATMTTQLDTVRAVLADVPGEFDMIEENPDEGMRMFCCGGDVHRKYAGGGGWTYHVGHASDCWYVRLVQLRDDLADNPEE